MCNCDAEFKPQPVAVDNVVTDPPTETNQMKSDNFSKKFLKNERGRRRFDI